MKFPCAKRANANISPIAQLQQRGRAHPIAELARVYRVPELVDQLQIPSFTAVRQVSRKTGTVKAYWKDVLKEQANKLFALHGHIRHSLLTNMSAGELPREQPIIGLSSVVALMDAVDG